MKATITVGVSASGKTTWANSQNAQVVSRDDKRRVILEQRLGRPLKPGELWSKWKFGKDESLVTELCDQHIFSAAHQKQDIIVADTNLNKDRNDKLKFKLEKLGYNVEFKEFPVTFEEACKRDAGRPDGVGYSVLYNQYQQWLSYSARKKYVPNVDKPKAIVVDVDGTLAKMNGRGAFDWNRVGEDLIRDEIRDMVRGYYSMGYEIIIVSGRDGVCRDLTEDWFITHSVPYSKFFIRTAGDMRDDRIIKEEIFWRDIADNYNVKLVVDDRPKVVRAWMEMGLNVAIVGNPYVEF